MGFGVEMEVAVSCWGVDGECSCGGEGAAEESVVWRLSFVDKGEMLRWEAVRELGVEGGECGAVGV